MDSINRRQFISAAAAAALAVSSRGATASPQRRPNILLVLADQISFDAVSAVIGDRYIHTPNIDALRAQGMAFNRAYVANPICVPSRTSMFTGRYPVETGIQTNETAEGRPGEHPPDPAKFPLMGRIFRDAGYRTGYFGKWHLPYPNKGTDAEVSGFEVMQAEVVDTETADHVNAFMGLKSDRPFLAVASFLNPHNICEWARGDRLNQGALPDPPPAGQCPPLRPDHGIMQDEPEIMGIMRQAYHNSPLFPVGGYDDAKWRQYEWAYYRLVERVDALVGKVTRHLIDEGLADNTVVLFTGDHGDCQGAHFFNQKTVLFEESVRVPFVLSFPPRISPGTTDMLINTGVDLLPTLCEFAGIQTDIPMSGISLVPAAAGRVKHPKRDFVVTSDHLVQGAPVNGVNYTPQGRMIRTERYKYCVYSEGKDRESLVDLTTDPGEMVNLVRDPRHRAELLRHRALLRNWGAQFKDSFPYMDVDA